MVCLVVPLGRLNERGILGGCHLSVFGNQDMFLLGLFVHILFPCDMLVFSLSEKLCAQAFTEFLNAVCLWVHRFENYLGLKREGSRFENLSWFLTEKGRNEV